MSLIKLSTDLLSEIGSFTDSGTKYVFSLVSKQLQKILKNPPAKYNLEDLSLDMAVWYFENGVRDLKITEAFARYNDEERFEEALLRGTKLSSEMASQIVSHGNVDFVSRMIDLGLDMNVYAFTEAIKVGLEMLKVVLKECIQEPNRFNIKIAIQYNRLDCLIYLISEEKLVSMDSAFIEYAIKFKKLEILEWLHSNYCEWPSNALYLAAKMGDLKILKYVTRNGSPNHVMAAAAAAGLGYLSCLREIVFVRKYVHPTAYNDAAENGHLDIMKFLKVKRCCFPYDTVCVSAVKHIQCLMFAFEYLYEGTFVHYDLVLYRAKRLGCAESVAFIEANAASRNKKYKGKMYEDTMNRYW